MKYKIIFLDIDGTLTDSRKLITEKTRRAIMKAAENGLIIAVASGRPEPGLAYAAGELEMSDIGGYLLPFNGGIIKNAMTEDSAATSFSFFAIPIATPMANIIGRLVNTIFPASFITRNIALNTVPGPIAFKSPYVFKVVSLENEPPIPSNNPATGKIAIGSIKLRPTLCKTPNILSFI